MYTLKAPGYFLIFILGALICSSLPEFIQDPYGRFSHNEGCNCNPKYSTTKCDTNGQCECHPGFHGADCTIRCSCMNQARNICDPYDGNCYCRYLFDNPRCANRCQCHLENTAHCHMRKCHCKLGFYGKGCDKACNCGPNSFGINCDEFGYCNCLNGFYGKLCERECNCRHALSRTCSSRGHCNCNNGFKGRLCGRTCGCNENGTFHNRCDQLGGICNCKEGFTGMTCDRLCGCNYRNTISPSCDIYDTCQCLPGFYGKHCKRQCHCQNSINNKTCDAEGVCPCLPTHYGRHCEYECECNRSIYNECDYRGYCSCLPGFYGKKCDKECTHCDWAKSTRNCDHSGYCECRPGFYGKLCEKTGMSCGKIYTNEWYSRKSGRIVNGLTPNGPVPWLVRIYLKNLLVCAGAILNENYVVTLADCFVKTEEASEIKILAADFSSVMNDTSEMWYQVEKMVLPKKINFERNFEDVVLLKVKLVEGRGFIFSSSIQPVCIPAEEVAVLTPMNAFYAGWGYTNNYMKVNELKTVGLSMILSSDCAYKTDLSIRPNIICATTLPNEGHVCLGEKGTPLTLVIDNIHYLIGLYTRGNNDCLRPGISFFSNFSKYTNWVRFQVTNYPIPTLPP